VSSQSCVVQAGLLRLIIRATRALVDYEVHVNLYSAMSSLLLSPHADVSSATVAHGCLNELLATAEKSQYFKVRRICNNTLNNAGQELYDLNQAAPKAGMQKHLF